MKSGLKCVVFMPQTEENNNKNPAVLPPNLFTGYENL